jgi:uncharacterized membrane protein YeiB
MDSEMAPQGVAVDPPTAGKTGKDRPRRRLVGIDAARGLALVGLMAVHILPDATADGGPTLAWTLFNGNSAALFALLAGVGLALSTGGRIPHAGRRLAGDRAGLAVRAGLVGAIGLVVSAVLPWDPPADNILVYYAVFFLLAIPFLSLRPRTLFGAAAAFGLAGPVAMQWLGPALPESSDFNHTVVTVFTEPAGTASELLLTGSYPALCYLAYLLAGLGLGRLDLRDTRIQALIAAAGAGLAVLAHLASALLLTVAGGYDALLDTPGMGTADLDQALVFGPEDIIPDTSWWWLAIATPHTNTPLALASGLGIGMAVLGVFLLVSPRAGRWLVPLAAMGTMTLTLYTGHLLALAPELHYDRPGPWFVLHLAAAVVFAWVWHRRIGRGPLETIVARAVNATRDAVAHTTPGTHPAPGATATPTATPVDRAAR